MPRPRAAIGRGRETKPTNAVGRIVAGVVELPDAPFDDDPTAFADKGVPLTGGAGEIGLVGQRDERRQFGRERRPRFLFAGYERQDDEQYRIARVHLEDLDACQRGSSAPE